MNYGIIMPRLTQIYEQTYSFPIGIAYVSASLKRTGRNVITFNLNYKPLSIKEAVKEFVRENKLDVIATGGLSAQYWQIKEILEAAREEKPDIITWVGGGIITSAPEVAMRALEIADFGMIGEGELTICELADALEKKRSFSSVNGIIYRNADTWMITEQREEIEDLDSLPYPDYEGFEFGELLNKIPTDLFALGKDRFGFLSFGRSCPFQCTFCFHPSGSKYRRRSMKSIFEEIDFLIEKFDIRNIYITDELFVSNIEDVREFCYQIKKRGIGFSISLRVNMVNREMLTLLRDHGCIQISFGLESADNRILKSMKKHITIEQIENALSLCNELGINAQGGFIFGDQEETIETARNTIEWWKAHPQYSITLNLIVLYPGSELYQNAVKRGIIEDEVEFLKEGCPLKNISKMTDEEYKTIALTISMLPQERTHILKDAKVEYVGFGKVNYKAKCPKCEKEQIWKALDVFRIRGNLICPECGYAMHVVVADSIGEEAERNFQKIKGNKIGVWPMVNAVAEIERAIPSIMEENVWFIDSAEMKHGVKYKNKVIEYPDIIEKEGIDTIILTITTPIATEIIDEIKEKYPSVKRILFAGELVNPEFLMNEEPDNQ